MYNDSTVRPLTLEESNTNKAHDIWYSKLNPQERFQVSLKVQQDLNPQEKLNACINYIEDNLEAFK